MEQIKGFKNVNVLTEEGIVKTNLIIENGKIAALGSEEVDELVTLSDDLIVIPGFIDQHIHGAAGSDAMDGTLEDLSKIANALAKEGTTAFLATTMTQSPANIDKALACVNDYINHNYESGALVLGVHLEGPFISKDFVGAQPIEYVAAPSVDVFKHYEEVSGGHIKLVSMAVEVEGAEQLVSYLASKKIVASIGHSNAKYADVARAVAAGATNVTHTYNAQKPIHHREVGTVGAAMLFDELHCEAICDGIHLSAPAIKLLHKNKPSDKFILITDAMRAKHMPDGVSELGGQVVIVKNGEARLENGTLAGSVLKMNNAVKNVMDFIGTSLEETVKYASANPAKNLGVYDQMGSIAVGKLANLVVVDKDVNVYQTIRCGKVIYRK